MSNTPEASEEALTYFIPFPSMEDLAVIGDRRTSATIAADGTVCWFCLPRFDATAMFGALLDIDKGGYWRFGPEDRVLGRQEYLPGTAVLTTIWEESGSRVELTDCMLWPEDEREVGLAHRRVLLRRLRCVSGARKATLRLVPQEDFRIPARASTLRDGYRIQTPAYDLGVWCSRPLDILPDEVGVHGVFDLAAGDEIWAILDEAAAISSWNIESASAALERTIGYWRDWSERLNCTGSRAEKIRLSAIAVHLLTYAETGAVIAAPTSSLPERVPGEYNYDYRYCWVRDGSLSISLLAELGVIEPVGKFLSWMAGLVRPPSGDESEMPLQVLYRVDGGAKVTGTERPDISGYRSCKPVQFGNPAYQMKEIDSFGYIADCALLFVRHGGELTDAHWELVRRSADFIVANWEKPAAGIWELMPEQHFVVTKVMCWVTLDRALAIAELVGRSPSTGWSDCRDRVHAEVMKKGWCERTGSFRQRYDSEALDGALLLIPLMGFLPADHERVRGTVEQVAAVLSLNGLVHRFVPARTPGRPKEAIGDREGSFLMCNFWLAQAWSMLDEPDKAEAAMARAEACTGATGLFSEAGDARHTPGLLGNTPLLFSQVEYARAASTLG